MNIIKKNFFKKRVLIIGHTGFKGSWLSLWLQMHGAKVIGISNDIPTKPSNYKVSQVNNYLKNIELDIRNLSKLKKTIKKLKPDFVFHLAAQALVKEAFLNPIKTWETNVLGTVNVLESLKEMKKKCVAIIITSDKCYKNLEINRGYKENDILGGSDPYSASKASAELAIKSYLESFINLRKSNLVVGIARAGNVIGGGDWSKDRLIPDCMKSWSINKKVKIRNPNFTRPWQHVLEALWGYILLSIKLNNSNKFHGEAFNFGPNSKRAFTVINLLKKTKKHWNKIKWKVARSNKFYESKLLSLNSSKAQSKLNWKSVLNFDEMIQLVVFWYKNFYQKKTNMHQYSISQIKFFENLLKKRFKVKL